MVLQVLLLMVSFMAFSTFSLQISSLMMIDYFLATSNRYELPVSIWNHLHCSQEDTLPRRWNATVLSRNWCCARPRFAPRPHFEPKLNILGPVSRFGDTAANAGILALLQSNSYLSGLPSPIKTVFASLWQGIPYIIMKTRL